MRALVLVVLVASCTRDCNGVGSTTPQTQPPPSVEVCDATWEPRACLDAGRYWEARDRRPRAVVAFRRGCQNHLLEACLAGLRHDTVYFRARACELGSEDSCFGEAGTVVDPAQRRAIVEPICMRRPATCHIGARMLVGDAPEAALALVLHACGVPEVDACERGSELPFRERDDQLAVAKAACAHDRPAPCYRLAMLSRASERRPLLVRACQLQHAPACEALGALDSGAP